MIRLTGAFALAAGPALAATGPFVSLRNTDFVVLLAFIGFIAVLIYFKVPGLLGGMLEKRADTIQSELDEARTLREEAQSLLASYDRKQRDVQAEADRIVDRARKEAAAASEQARKDLELSITRRMQAAEEQIAQAQASAVRDVRDQAVALSIAAARDIMAHGMRGDTAAALIDASIDEVGQRLH